MPIALRESVALTVGQALSWGPVTKTQKPATTPHMTDVALYRKGLLPLGQLRHVEVRNSDRVRRLIALYVSVLVFFLSAYAGVLNDFLGIGILTALVLIGFPDVGRSSAAAVVALTGFALFTVPYIGLIYVGAEVQTAWFAGFIIVGLAIVNYGRIAMPPMARPGSSRADLLLITIFLVVGLLLWGDAGLNQVSFYAGWACALVHLERLHARTTSRVARLAGLLVFALVIGYFVTVLWTGGGRIIQLSFAMAPILLSVAYGAFGLNGVVLAAAAVVLSFVGRLLRFGWSDGLAGLSEDSGASPITITSYLWNTKDTVLNAGSIYEQWVLFFVNWFPRDLWPDKPLGIGSTFVDAVIGRQGVGAEHNLAIGFFGEHLLFLPNGWIVSVTLLVLVVIVGRRALSRMAAPYIAPVIVFDVWLITLFWGGMAAFAARAWFALLPALPYVLLIKWLDRRGDGTAANLARAPARGV